MISLWQMVALASIAYYFFISYRQFSRNLADAKKSGIPYVIVPIYVYTLFWFSSQRFLLPLLKKLPESWTSPWLYYLEPNWSWPGRYSPFEKLEMDALMHVTPRVNTLFVADAEAIAQITSRRSDFPKPIEMYRNIDIYGSSVVTTEGSVWRHHRKITSPSFTESNNFLVFKESVQQAKSMLDKWHLEDFAIRDPGADSMRLTLYVISRAGFGMRLLWPHEEAQKNATEGRINLADTELPAGHSFSFIDALSQLLDRLIWVAIFPEWFLAISPFKAHKVAYRAHKEWFKYMKEMLEKSKQDIRLGIQTEGLDLFGAIVKGAGVTVGPDNGEEKKSKQLLTDGEIFSNAFVFLLAGHETTANTLHYSLIYLAMCPDSQKRLQKELEDILGDRPANDWDYDKDFTKLFGGMPGAVMNEILRLIPPVIGIPKKTSSQLQPLTISGKRVVVPASTYVTLNSVAVQRSPRYWPAWRDPDGKLHENDLNEFRPERWLPGAVDGASHDHSNGPEDADTEGIGGPASSHTPSSLYTPPRGAFIPFSEGFRSCLGRRFAQVELCAVLAYIFRTWSVELDVGEWATDEEVERMSEEARRQVWEKAKDRADWLFAHGMRTAITIKMSAGKVPLRLVKKGEERFAF
ncbi:cytochrome P450 monooxygenase-like protein [Patellaria atrata CBS 101060]|uniref:Cytochrome P450 monooxygenase-like protein n=1 Tax=Patellaria atrata CBS 101060 TaxID=1346257 RepID=A0A9P4S3L7_9PEZI|nr:cytochrome P450 monooxygenase-like protein [Patellaria atrata CBS 101060]